ncbi:hypothetical protein A2372_00820 [Candidatus Wolfebacteria bacterium RIFOXYB1_FULL_54_12]|uniref:TVP38/TMEM64 family membrane protein n=1 Tax=Candidatus Wolfebacteria bacterium RIFOXYB1_FULL_54_12 TaxID=1802559 RepID=A0A1F8DVT5_9BACT|nr:MAG: hypothetical protein A2372_00820 [Candidatus Wolfebacteria bacterium RIFOXYB1_FULL_54_12]
MNVHLPHPIAYYRAWKYRNTGLLAASLVLFFFIAETQFVHDIVTNVGTWGYPGMFIVGMFYVFTFTVAPALAILYEFTAIYSPLTIALAAGIGSVAGDFLLFRFVRDGITEELKPLFKKLEGSTTLYQLFHTPYFLWLTPIIGAIIVASPFPDEVGVSILGLSHVKQWKFILLVFFLNVAGIFLIIHAAQLL